MSTGTITPDSRRLPSIDVARGLTIAGMIVVNTAGGFPVTHPWLMHARWNGWTIADLGMPAFLFLVGAAAHFSVSARLERGDSRRDVARHALIRAALLFALGIAATGFPRYALETTPMSGVLQRIAVIYAAMVTFELLVGPTTEAMTVALILVVFAALASIEAPSGPVTGVRARDARDLYTLLPGLASALVGVLAGRWLRARNRPPPNVLAGSGAILMIGGMFWSRWLPINKQLWTSSYTVFTAGVAAVGLGVISGLVDHRARLPRWTTLLVALGRNSLLVYAGSTAVDELMERYVSIGVSGQPITPKLAGYLWLQSLGLSAWEASTAYAVAYAVPWIALAYWLHRREVVLRI